MSDTHEKLEVKNKKHLEESIAKVITFVFHDQTFIFSFLPFVMIVFFNLGAFSDNKKDYHTSSIIILRYSRGKTTEWLIKYIIALQ